jgi:hypothetical protein
MTQASLFGDELRVCTIDADCIIGLDGMHDVLDGYVPILEFSDSEREAIWKGLEQLAQNGRLKIVPAVRDEIRRRNPLGYQRLAKFTRTTVQINNRVRRNYQILIEQHSDWAPRGVERYEKGDPWMIAYAMDRSWQGAITESGVRVA